MELCLFDRLRDPVPVPFRIHELQRVPRTHPPVVFLERIRVQEYGNVLLAPDTEVCVALHTGEEILFELHLVDDLTALFALRPEPVGDILLLSLRGDVFLGPLEPRHGLFALPVNAT